jgi:hypothetical protein
LRVSPHAMKLSCSYTINAGIASESPFSAPAWPAWQAGTVPPATSWYFIVAVCPENEYLTASWDTKIRSKDGK